MSTPDPLRVVVFGPARSGKSALAGLLDRHLATQGVRVLDADGRAAGEVLEADAPVRADRPLTAEVLAADALVLVVDAAAEPAVVDRAFAAFGSFLERLEEGRAAGRAVGGLPVVLTLAKCDALLRPGDEPTDWLRRVEDRKAEVQARFQGRFADELLPPPDGYLAFGSLELHLAATAKDAPPGPAFRPYADPGGTFGVSDLVQALLPAARDHRDRADGSRKRLVRTAAGLGGLVSSLLLGLGLLALLPEGDPLAERVRAFRRREGPPAVRLADRALPAVRKELEAVQDDPGFDRLPADLQGFVRARLAEVTAFAEFRDRFLPPRLGPAEVRTRPQMDQLAADLRGPLAVPPEYAADWAETPAGRLSAKWATDLSLLEAAERGLHDWFRGQGRRGDLLLLTESPPDPAWRTAVGRLLAEPPPHAPAEPVPGSPTVPGPRGKPLTYAAAFAVDRVGVARRDWDETAHRLTVLREVTDAVGLTAAGPLVLPEPVPKGFASQVLPTLPADDRWRTDRFPDPVRGVVVGRLRATVEAGVRGLRPQLPADADALLADPDWRAWGELLRRLNGWASPGVAAADPVRELADFLRRDRFAVDLRTVRVTLPDDLLDPPPTPAGPLVVVHTPAGGSPQTITLEAGPPVRDRPNTVYPFAGPELTVRPGDTLSATLPVRSGTDTREVVWPAGSGKWAFLRLGRPPRLGDAEAAGVLLAAPGLVPPVLLADPGGR